MHEDNGCLPSAHDGRARPLASGLRTIMGENFPGNRSMVIRERDE
jgi:hypothetical protein